MFTYKILASENATTYGNGNATCRLEITNTDTNETRVCDDFTYLDDDTQENLQWLFETDFGANDEFYDVLVGHLAKIDAATN